MFEIFDRNKQGTISAQDIQIVLNKMGEYLLLDEIEEKIENAGGENENLTFEQFKEVMANSL